jgi:hypothetical protein
MRDAGETEALDQGVPLEPGSDSTLQAWQRVYEDLSEEDIAEVEAIALDRSGFLESRLTDQDGE